MFHAGRQAREAEEAFMTSTAPCLPSFDLSLLRGSNGDRQVNGSTATIVTAERRKQLEMADYVAVGAVADVYVEYHGEQDSADSSSGSDFEDEIVSLTDCEPDVVITAAEPAESDTYLLITDETGVVREVISSPQKHRTSSGRPQKHTVPGHDNVAAAGHDNVAAGHDVAAAGHDNVSEGPFSQVLDPSQHTVAAGHDVAAPEHDSASDSDSDFVYIPHSDDSGEDSEVVELRRHARKFKKRMGDSKSWIGSDATSAVPIDLIANMEQQIEAEQDDWKYDSSDEDYSYDEDSDGETTTVPQAFAPGTKASRFKPPRKRVATTEAGPSTSGVTGTGAKRGRRKAASSIPSYSYFTCSGNY
ncbi:hypothetical protein ZWY2020_022882 [Hordeum vulgare]|nr:hypothetical protein ZWY2020_022882 [Hordeum vulgare]